MPKNRRTLVVVADAASARLLASDGPRGALRLLPGGRLENPDAHGFARELGSDRPGRVVESVGGGRHAVEPRSDPHRQAKANFAKRLADEVERRALRHEFDRLLLVAPPQMLGDLRAALGHESKRFVAATLDLDLTKLSAADIGARLESIEHG